MIDFRRKCLIFVFNNMDGRIFFVAENRLIDFVVCCVAVLFNGAAVLYVK